MGIAFCTAPKEYPINAANSAASGLYALGRLSESIEPMRVSGEIDVEMKDWKGAAISHSNLSDLELTLGDVAEAVRDAETAVIYAIGAKMSFRR